MKSSKTWRFLLAVAGAGLVAAAAWHWWPRARETTADTETITISNGTIRATITTTGTVEPQNRLEVKPAISGRIESILVREGDAVQSGQVLAWISSTERAALLDAARARGDAEVAYWQEVYKPAPLIAPIDGQVIVRAVEPGQTITPSSTVVVLSDRLIAKAQVDETDIGSVRRGQPVEVTLDAYPEVRAEGVVDHISYESTIVNNVTVYETDIAIGELPEVFKSGMSAEVIIVTRTAANVPVIRLDAVSADDEGDFVFVPGGGRSGTRRRVVLGARDREIAEVAEGLSAGDTVIVRRGAYALPQADERQNPFLPVGGGGRRGGRR